MTLAAIILAMTCGEQFFGTTGGCHAVSFDYRHSPVNRVANPQSQKLFIVLIFFFLLSYLVIR
jgi:hypothetical protein